MRRARRTTPSAVAGYSLWIRWLKILLPISAVALIATVFVIGRWSGESVFSTEELARLGGGLELENPKFSGKTASGAPFVVVARRATPDGAAPDLIALELPEGEMLADDNRKLKGRSDHGVMRRSTDELTLTGNVVITTSDGYRAETHELIVDLNNKTAVAPGPVEADGPAGSITAGRFELRRPEEAGSNGGDNSILWFEKDVRVIFIPGQSR